MMMNAEMAVGSVWRRGRPASRLPPHSLGPQPQPQLSLNQNARCEPTLPRALARGPAMSFRAHVHPTSAHTVRPVHHILAGMKQGQRLTPAKVRAIALAAKAAGASEITIDETTQGVRVRAVLSGSAPARDADTALEEWERRQL